MQWTDMTVDGNRVNGDLLHAAFTAWVDLPEPRLSALSAELYRQGLGRTISGNYAADRMIQKARKAGAIRQVKRGVWGRAPEGGER